MNRASLEQRETVAAATGGTPEDELRRKTQRRHPILLDYRDTELERKFLRFYTEETRPLIQAAFLLSIPAWAAGLYLLFLLIPDKAPQLLLITLAVVLPFTLFALSVRDHDRWIKHYQPIALCSNIATGLLVMYICHHLEGIVAHIMPIGTMLMVFIGLYALRLRARYAIASSLILVGGYLAYLLNSGQETEEARLLLITSMGILEVFACMAAYLSEYTYRQMFEQQQWIQWQKSRIASEHARAERLLLNILPPSIAKRLQHDEQVIADRFERASVLFSDIVGFTKLSSTISAPALVSMLNELFSHFDALVDRAGLEKIKTIGDAYMVAAGMPIPMARPTHALAALALNMLQVVEEYNQRHGTSLQLRIGIHTGPVIAGVIGMRKFVYDVWGDTVNMASRMESHGLAGHIQVSEAVYEQLREDYRLQARGEIHIKGKGTMRTWFLLGKASSDTGPAKNHESGRHLKENAREEK